MKGTIEMAQHYRDRAAKLRTMAEIEYEDKPWRDLLALAGKYEKVAVEILRPTPRYL